MSAKDIKEFKNCIVRQLVKQYNMDEFSARKAVRSSYLTIALKLDADTAMHDPIEYWAEYIYEEELHEGLKEM